MSFAHLHLHTEYSLLDGATKIGELFEKCEERGVSAVAITDHGNMYGVLEFLKAAARFTYDGFDKEYKEKNGFDFYSFMANKTPFRVKPIIGCEVYLTENMHTKVASDGKMPKNNHLILLAKNETGYKNLIKMVSLAYTEGLYYKPRIDFELLSKHAEGLVCLSACLAGIIPQRLLNRDYKGADAWVKRFKNLFGEDFYIELQDHALPEQRYVLPLLKSLADENGVKTVVTNDVHYLSKDDALMQKVLQNISYNRTMPPVDTFAEAVRATAAEGGDYFPTDEFYLKSEEEMLETFSAYRDGIENTLEVADKCECYYFRKEKLLPPFIPDTGETPACFLRRLCEEGLKAKYKEITKEVRDRAEYELSVIEKLGFVEYFLIVWDFIHYAETHGVPVGPGRGSGVGSIVAYAIGITKVNPLKYSLIFERFLNVERVTNPDFDIDFCVEGREKVIEYVVEKYGAENVSQIVTFSTLAAKAAVKDVGRVFNQPYSEVDKLTKLMPKMMGKNHIGHLLGILKPKKKDENPVIPELIDIYNSEDIAHKILDMSMKIEGMPRQTGMHAAGVIICKDAISNHIPMAKNGDGIITTEYNMIECEELGLLKMDFLGLTTLTDINKAVKYVKQNKGIDLDFYNMEYNDQGVFDLISEGDTHAVFQLESEGMKKFMRDLKPNCLEDIIAGISLYRPGPMDKIGDYVKNKRNPDGIVYDHELLEPILKVTYGVTIYQEQVMEIVRKLAGYSFGAADGVRRNMSKKKVEAMEKDRANFVYGSKDGKIPGCIKAGVPEEVANKIYDDLISFASYAFNKSHATAYAYLAYQTAFLKKYHTAEFIAAVLNNRITKIDEIRNYLSYLKERNIPVYPPSINRSFGDFTVENGGVRIGLAALKNVGGGIVQSIVEVRKDGDFSSFKDFAQRMFDYLERENKTQINKKLLESLIFAGAFDELGVNRATLMNNYERVMDIIKRDASVKVSGQCSFFDMMGGDDEFDYKPVNEYSPNFKLQMEKEVAGVYLTGHPLEAYREKLQEMPCNTYALSEEGASFGTVTLGGMLVDAEKRYTKMKKEIGIGKLEDLQGTVDVMISGEKLQRFRGLWQKDKLVTLTGRVSYREDMPPTVWVDSISPWAETKKVNKKMCIYFSDKEIADRYLDEVKSVLDAYEGEDEVYISYIDGGKKIVSRFKDVSVSADEMLINELYGFNFIQNIKISG